MVNHQLTAPRIIVALDFPNAQNALAFVDRLDPQYCRLKIGHILFTHYGPGLVETLIKRGFSIFLDLKFHDIPNTVAGACRAAADLGVWMLNIHVLGGRKMLEAAANEIAKGLNNQRQNKTAKAAIKQLSKRCISGDLFENKMNVKAQTPGEEQASVAYFSQKLGSNLLVLPAGELPPDLLQINKRKIQERILAGTSKNS